MTGQPCASTIGPADAKIAIVGRNPGRTEAETGEPFTGPSGYLLNAVLEVAGLKREEILITNAVQCHLQGDVPPSKGLYATCHDRLMEDIAQAKIVISFGTEATQALLGSSVGGIMSIVGSLHILGDHIVLPTFHPAYILRGAVSAYDDLEETIKRAAGLANGSVPMPKPLPTDDVYYCESEEDIRYVLKALIQGTHTLAIDTETVTARDPNWEIILIQLSDGQSAWVFDAPTMIFDPEARALFRQMLQDPDRTWIFHNAAFDLQQLWHHFGVMPDNVEDTMCLALCLDEHLNRAGLKRLVNRYLSVPHYEEEVRSYIRSVKNTFADVPRDLLVQYGGYDAIFTYQLFPILCKEVEKEGNATTLYPMLVDSQRVFARMAYDGVPIDMSYVESLREQYYPLRDKLAEDMQTFARDKGFKATEVVKKAKSEVLNPDSPTQLMWFITRYLRLATDTTDKTFIDKYINHPFVQMLAKYRAINKMLDTYVDGIADDVWPDGHAHPDFLHGTETGRLTIKNPPLQTLPRDGSQKAHELSSIKRLFRASPGCTMVHVDYKGLELRMAWDISKDPDFGDAIMKKTTIYNGVEMKTDFHRTVAAAIHKISPDEVTSEQRVASKFVTFGIMYGRQAYSITGDMNCTEEEAKEFIERFYIKFPAFAQWNRDIAAEAVRTGVLTTRFGRRRRWKLITPEIELGIRREAMNFPIQSQSTDACLISMIRLDGKLRDLGWGRILFTVHDSIEFEIKQEHLDEACELIKVVMEHPFPSTAVFEVDIEYGPSLGELQEWKPPKEVDNGLRVPSDSQSNG